MRVPEPHAQRPQKGNDGSETKAYRMDDSLKSAIGVKNQVVVSTDAHPVVSVSTAGRQAVHERPLIEFLSCTPRPLMAPPRHPRVLHPRVLELHPRN